LKAEVFDVTFEIKLKAGFFKTQTYYLTVEAEQIILTPLDDPETERQVIDKKELKSISIYSRNMTSGELEIITHSNTYLGSISSSADLEELTRCLALEFGDKFNFQHGNV